MAIRYLSMFVLFLSLTLFCMRELDSSGSEGSEILLIGACVTGVLSLYCLVRFIFLPKETASW